MMRRVGNGCESPKDVAIEREAVEIEHPQQRIDVGHLALNREVLDIAVGHAHATHVVRDYENAVLRHPLPCSAEVSAQLYRQVAPDIRRKDHRHAVAHHGIGDVRTVGAADVLNLRLHHSPSRTAQTRTASPTPFSACSPRSSNRTPAEVRASERTVSETSTSPGADSPLIRAAMLTAPP